MTEFIGIWFNATSEVHRDHVRASDANEASAKIHALYAGRSEPAECLSVVPASGSYDASSTVFTSRSLR